MQPKDDERVGGFVRRVVSIGATAALTCVITPTAFAIQSGNITSEPLPDAEAYLKRGEAFAGAMKYDLAIADYTMNRAVRQRDHRYESADGVTWTVVGSDTVAIGPSAYIALAVSSHVSGMLATATFDQVTPTHK